MEDKTILSEETQIFQYMDQQYEFEIIGLRENTWIESSVNPSKNFNFKY